MSILPGYIPLGRSSYTAARRKGGARIWAPLLTLEKMEQTKMSEDKRVSITVLKARAGMREALRRELLKLIAPTRREPGNLDYVLFELQDEPGTFYMREAFINQAALDSHCQTDYFQAFAAKAEALLAEPLRLIFMEEVSLP
ncbi:TPA: antibiotic biosynthesis monooxygenase [Aeromonas hydrophila]|nr:antibiotic biosynthesis monooxygenase [Aeromonas hydrophila]